MAGTRVVAAGDCGFDYLDNHLYSLLVGRWHLHFSAIGGELGSFWWKTTKLSGSFLV